MKLLALERYVRFLLALIFGAGAGILRNVSTPAAGFLAIVSLGLLCYAVKPSKNLNRAALRGGTWLGIRSRISSGV